MSDEADELRDEHGNEWRVCRRCGEMVTDPHWCGQSVFD